MNKQVERDKQQFRTLVNGSLAKMIARANSLTDGQTDRERQETVRQALLWCWINREWYAPNVVWIEFFTEGLEYALTPSMARLEDTDGLVASLNHEPEVRRPSPRTRLDDGLAREREELHFGAGETPPGKEPKDCPPCWRCRYFDGWLPTGKVALARSKDPDVQESLRRIDEGKVRVALWVRSKGLENMERGA